jgi:hypothetical protein
VYARGRSCLSDPARSLFGRLVRVGDAGAGYCRSSYAPCRPVAVALCCCGCCWRMPRSAGLWCWLSSRIANCWMPRSRGETRPLLPLDGCWMICDACAATACKAEDALLGRAVLSGADSLSASLGTPLMMPNPPSCAARWDAESSQAVSVHLLKPNKGCDRVHLHGSECRRRREDCLPFGRDLCLVRRWQG